MESLERLRAGDALVGASRLYCTRGQDGLSRGRDIACLHASAKLTVTEYGYPSEQIVEVSRAGMNQCLEKMAAIF